MDDEIRMDTESFVPETAASQNDCMQEPAHERKDPKGIRMPFGAIVACILSLALLAGAVFAGIKYIDSNIAWFKNRLAKDAAGRSGTSDQLESPLLNDLNGSSGDAEPTDSPSGHITYAAGVQTEDERYTLIKNSMDAVVSIDVMVSSGYSDVKTSSGSGVIITPDGYVVTCNHVVENADKVYVYLNDGSSSEAKLVGRDMINDLAVIKIEGSDFPYAALGDSSSLHVGEKVFAIGNALGELPNTYTEGCISGLDRVIKVEGQEMTLLQTDAAINHGNSGGGLFRSSDGALIGIVNAKSAGSDIEGLGFAIPTAVVGQIVRDLMDYGFVAGRPYIGVSTEDVTLSGYGFFTSYYTYPRIVAIEDNSPAADSELRVGDIIMSVDGISISGTDSLVRTLNSYRIGDTVSLTVLRDRTSIDITITLGERALPER